MKKTKFRTTEEWQKVVDEQGKACRKLTEVIKEKNQKIFELSKELKHYKTHARHLEIQIEKLELGE